MDNRIVGKFVETRKTINIPFHAMDIVLAELGTTQSNVLQAFEEREEVFVGDGMYYVTEIVVDDINQKYVVELFQPVKPSL